MSRRQRSSFEPVEDKRLPHVGVSEAKRQRGGAVHLDMAPQDSFTILPPLVQPVPAPPTAPAPYRLSHPVSNRARKASFVILSDAVVTRSASEEQQHQLQEEWRKAQNKPSRIPRSRPGSRDPSPLQRRLSDSPQHRAGSRIPQPLSPARHIKTAGDGGSPKRLAPRANGLGKRQSLSPLQKRSVVTRGRDRNVRGRSTAKERSPTVSRGTSPIREITGRLPEPQPPQPAPADKAPPRGRGRANGPPKRRKSPTPGSKTQPANGKPPLPNKTATSRPEEGKPAAAPPAEPSSSTPPAEPLKEPPKEPPPEIKEPPAEKPKVATFKPDEVVYVTPTMASPQSTTVTATISRAPNLSSTAAGISAFRNTTATPPSSSKLTSALGKGPTMSSTAAGIAAFKANSSTPPSSVKMTTAPTKGPNLSSTAAGISAFKNNSPTPPSSGKAGNRGINISSAATGISAFKTSTPPSSAKLSRGPNLTSAVTGMSAFRANSPKSSNRAANLSSTAAGISAFRAPSPKLSNNRTANLSSTAAGISAFRATSPKLSSNRTAGITTLRAMSPKLSNNRIPNLSSTTAGISAFRNTLGGKQQPATGTRHFPRNLVTYSVASSFKSAASRMPPVDSPTPGLEEPPLPEEELAVEANATLVESTTELAAVTADARPATGHTLTGMSSAKAAFLSGMRAPQAGTPGEGGVVEEKPDQGNGALTTSETLVKEDPELESLSANKLRSGRARAMAFLHPRLESAPPRAEDGGEAKPGLCRRVFCAPWRRVAALQCCQTCSARCHNTCERCKKKGDAKPAANGKATCCRKGNCCGKPSCCGKGCLARLSCCGRGKSQDPPTAHCCKKLDCCTGMKGACTKKPCTKERCCSGGCKAGTKKCCKAFVCLPFACCQKGGCPCKRDSQRRSVATLGSKKTSSVDAAEPEVAKLDPALVEHGSLMRAAIPVLPLPLAWICLILNVLVPGLGTLASGLLCLCFGKPRFSVRDDAPGRLGAFCVDLVIAVGQAFTVFFCLVGWGWSIWWGVIMLRLARKNRRLQKAEEEAAAAAPAPVATDQNHDVERAAAT